MYQKDWHPADIVAALRKKELTLKKGALKRAESLFQAKPGLYLISID